MKEEIKKEIEDIMNEANSNNIQRIVQYRTSGYIIAETWLNNIVLDEVIVLLSPDEFSIVSEDPLMDYNNFGYKQVISANLNITKRVKYIDNDNGVSIEVEKEMPCIDKCDEKMFNIHKKEIEKLENDYLASKLIY
jgi:hypothetical protein